MAVSAILASPCLVNLFSRGSSCVKVPSADKVKPGCFFDYCCQHRRHITQCHLVCNA
uniref:Uncharacterized protein n=1 Tax=uncultured marine virus TaxID=186617 RepID=A0A0F7L1Q4_9VIRU|nr:hypothetical protein [uncultured marine virus]